MSKGFAIPKNHNNADMFQNNFSYCASLCNHYWQDVPDSQSESEEVGSPRSTVSKGSSIVFSCDEPTYVPGEDGAMAMDGEQDSSSCSNDSPEDQDMDSDSDTLDLPGKDPVSVQIRKRRRMKSMDDDKDRVYDYVTSDSSFVKLMGGSPFRLLKSKLKLLVSLHMNMGPDHIHVGMH